MVVLFKVLIFKWVVWIEVVIDVVIESDGGNWFCEFLFEYLLCIVDVYCLDDDVDGFCLYLGVL